MQTSAKLGLLSLSTLLFNLLGGVFRSQLAIAATTDGPYTIYNPSEVDCSQSYTQLDLVELSIGRQPISVFCSNLSQNEPIATSELLADQQAQREAVPWGAPYSVEGYVCRDRSIGETVCFYPDAAERVEPLFIQTP